MNGKLIEETAEILVTFTDDLSEEFARLRSRIDAKNKGILYCYVGEYVLLTSREYYETAVIWAHGCINRCMSGDESDFVRKTKKSNPPTKPRLLSESIRIEPDYIYYTVFGFSCQI